MHVHIYIYNINLTCEFVTITFVRCYTRRYNVWFPSVLPILYATKGNKNDIKKKYIFYHICTPQKNIVMRHVVVRISSSLIHNIEFLHVRDCVLQVSTLG